MESVWMQAILVAAIGAFLAAIMAAVGAWRRPGGKALEALRERAAQLEARFEADLDRLRGAFEAALRDTAQVSGKAQNELALGLTARLEESRTSLLETVGSRFQQMQQAQIEALAVGRREQGEAIRGFQERLASDLARMRQDNETNLERIRATVDEKLHAALETRLDESFQRVSERLEQVHRGLGEMKSLASSVGDLKRVLTNVRSRGAFGEVQLEALLEQVLTPRQYGKNVATVPDSQERVEFAVRLPGRDGNGSIVHLPIDAKFPQEDYLRLQEAYEAGDAAAVEAARRALRARFHHEANTIHAKYLAPPHTTDFALLFVPTEGLYAEALRLPGLVETLQRERHVVLVGPTTLYAVLNSLQMGFRTLALEKRSSEVWKVLGAVKTEFEKFGRSLEEVRRKLREASNKIELSERRSRAIGRKLRDVETLPESDSKALLPSLDETEESTE